jgi:D-aminopeptidase
LSESRIVRPETTRLDISGGDWLLVKKRLNAGEQRRAFARMYREGAAGRLQIDPLQTGLALVLSYLLDWSLLDEAGKPIAIMDADDETKAAALDAIDYDSFVEIKNAIDAHQNANEAEAAAKKKIRPGAPSSAPSSPSPVAADGALSGSKS